VYSDVGDWIEARCKAGVRVLFVDPVSIADAGRDDAWVADRRLMLRAKEAAGEHGASVVLVSHPKAGQAGRIPALDGIAGGQAIPRLASTVLWLATPKDAHDEDAPPIPVCTLAHGTIPLRCNRIVHVLKARNGKGSGLKVGMLFDAQSFDFVEQGIAVSQSRPSRRGDAGGRARRMASTPDDSEDQF
jgi:hypothetical protein